MRKTFEFEDGVRLTSDFESGNLYQCFEFAPESGNQIPACYFEDEGGSGGADSGGVAAAEFGAGGNRGEITANGGVGKSSED